MRSHWISTAASSLCPFWGVFVPPRQIRTGLSNTLELECVQNVASNWWQEQLKKGLHAYLWRLPVSLHSSTFWLRTSALICTEKPELVSERASLGGWNQACLFCIHTTQVSLMPVLIFTGCITLHAPDCCPPTARLCSPSTCRWSRCADEKWSRCNREVHSSVKLNLSPVWENCRMLRKFIFGKQHLILAHILVY